MATQPRNQVKSRNSINHMIVPPPALSDEVWGLVAKVPTLNIFSSSAPTPPPR